ncbi:Trimeric GatFAB AmidoTransferase(AdT) complex subunit [Recurvomyces mirabilis]|uniref:Glutamyl-tRNA(Gln) amidotransferase subunit A, mitochondrial n=1 Tax=Recurvomyces mirabilis TaxID=574656 RepID=A0AAE1BYZ4_9PEZI|nr:Trimeric GatFAB AmidoTransferase(AdT) complex subunit [Recurvomyces mirabilis]KAK5150954.1 Trimeric GatFAB AmidoTransferase(AdT) complex subunit [Recurvomyces mirabilis]
MPSARFCLRPASRRLPRSNTRHHVTTSRPYEELNACITQHAPSPSSSTQTAKTVAIKDNIATKDFPTTVASNILAGFTSPFDATVVRLLRENDYTISTKTNLDEFGMGSHTQSSSHGPTLSPYSRNGIPLSPGGSSGGSAVEVLTGRSWTALGTDTGGSVRLPAAYLGVVGFKPSFGVVSRWGVLAYGHSLDTVGILGRRLGDVSGVFGVVRGWDGRDPSSLTMRVRERIEEAREVRRRRRRRRKKGGVLRIGVPLEYNIVELSPLVRSTYIRTLERLQSVGHTLHPISLPSTKQALSAYYVLAPAEASSNLAKYDGVRYGTRPTDPDSSPRDNLPLYAQTRGQGFGEEVKRRILLGAYTLSSEARDNYFIQAQKGRRLVQRDFDRVFALANPLLDPPHSVPDSDSTGGEQDEGVDVIITPTAPTLPPTIEEVKRQSPVESYMNDVFTVPASLAGLPAISMPVGLSEEEAKGLEQTDVGSVGVQVMGQFGDDEGVLDVASMIEEGQWKS